MGGEPGKIRVFGAAAALVAIAVATVGGLTGCAGSAGYTAFDRPQDERDALTGELATVVAEQADPSSVRWLYTDDDGVPYYAVRSRGMNCLLFESAAMMTCAPGTSLMIETPQEKLVFAPRPPSDEAWIEVGVDLWLLRK